MTPKKLEPGWRMNESKSALTKRSPETVAKVLEGIANGLTLTAASECAGITSATLNNWRKDDPALALAVQTAIAEARAVLETRVYDASVKNPFYALTILERRHPEDWSKNETQTAPKPSVNGRRWEELSPVERRAAISEARSQLDELERGLDAESASNGVLGAGNVSNPPGAKEGQKE